MIPENEVVKIADFYVLKSELKKMLEARNAIVKEEDIEFTDGVQQ